MRVISRASRNVRGSACENQQDRRERLRDTQEQRRQDLQAQDAWKPKNTMKAALAGVTSGGTPTVRKS
jgi:hypothetical protein